MDFAGSNGAANAAQHFTGDDGGSSPPLSSPPQSPEDASSLDPHPPPTHHHNHRQQPASRTSGFGVFDTAAPATSGSSTPVQPHQHNAAPGNYPPEVRLTAAGLPRKKPGRKPKPKDPNAPVPEKKPRKRVKTENNSADEQQLKPASRQSKITDLVNNHPSPVTSHPTPTRSPFSNNGVIHTFALSSSAAAPPPRPASSGQIFDPIRGATIDLAPPAPAIPRPQVSPTLSTNRASASPSIKSLVDPTPSIHVVPPSTSSSSRLLHTHSVTSAPAENGTTSVRSDNTPQPPMSTTSNHASRSTNDSQQPSPQYHSPMDIDNDSPAVAAPAATVSSITPTASSKNQLKRIDSNGGKAAAAAAPSPPAKMERAKQAPPPLPQGSGLLSGTPFGITASSTAAVGGKGANIWLTFPIKGQSNVTINFAHEVEKKYGFAALNPRLAERKERQRQLALATGELEKAQGLAPAGDGDMSLDNSDNESNEDGPKPMDEGTSSVTAAGGDVPVKKTRKKRTEDYDRNDDFIDDTEMMWQESALMAKDGFFVYSGPLVTEGDKPTIERADGTVIKRGRGRGRGGSSRGEGSRGGGRGSRGGGAAAGSGTGANGTGNTTGGGGGRGGTTVRKPRVTKADRAMMEKEKLEREKMAASIAARPPAGYSSSSLTSSSTLAGTSTGTGSTITGSTSTNVGIGSVAGVVGV